ncbi:MAG: hypothetical protein ABI904_09980 [Chloroflexota bacterium]
MQKQVRPNRFILLILTAALLLPACSTNTPINATSVASTPTSTVSSGPTLNSVVATSAVILIPSAPPAKNIDICSFFTSIDAQPLVGTVEINITPGSEADEITGGTLEYCTYRGEDVALLISLVKSSASKDSPTWQDQLLQMVQSSDPDAVITPAAGIGELAYWVITPAPAVGLWVAKYPYVFGLAVGGNISAPDDYQDGLQSLAQKVLDALP